MCRIVWGEIVLFARLAMRIDADCPAHCNRRVTLNRVIAAPSRFGSNAELAPSAGLAREVLST